jgi:uncharacterized membrane protein YgdD (TMEM256/DUF423 family)
LVVAAAVAGFVAVAFGAFGAHALRARLPADRMANLDLGVRYLFFHIAAILAVAWLSTLCGGELFETVAAWSFVLGLVLFSGSLMTLALTGEKRWGAVTPIGGVLLLIGWASLAIAAIAAVHQPAIPSNFLMRC